MHEYTQDIDTDLAAALRTGAVTSERPWHDAAEAGLAKHRADLHGIAGLLVGLDGWPANFAAFIRAEALGRAMWELRHQQVLAQLLDLLADNKVPALLMKGTAFAYDLYEEPAHRIRGDSDLWVREAQLGKVRLSLQQLGFRMIDMSEPAEPLQEEWVSTASDGSEHVIDLHWSAINSAALKGLFSFDDCWVRRRPLPRLARGAWGLNHADALLHSAVHREMHISSPYQVDGVTHFGGDRLIWIWDIQQLVLALGDRGLVTASDRASTAGLEAPLQSALLAAKTTLGAPVQDSFLLNLGGAGSSPAARYLQGGQMKRAWLDLKEVRPLSRKLATISNSIFPSAKFLRAKYGRSSKSALPALYLRRLMGFVRSRPDELQP